MHRNPSNAVNTENLPGMPAPTPEEQQQMLNYLMMLDSMKDSDPEAFAAAMSQLGIPMEDDENNRSNSNSNSKSNNEKVRETPAMLAAQIQKMREMTQDSNTNHAGKDEFNLPGNKGKLGTKGVEPHMKGIDITPNPGFTIKTRRISNNEKVFINICSHDEIAKPGLKKRLDENGEEVEGMNVPMSVGPAREAKDMSDNACIVYDIIVNPDVIEEATADGTGKYKDFVCQLGMQSLEQKYQEQIAKQYKLPKLKYLGNVVPQRIQDRKNMPKIEEVNGTGMKKKSSKTKKEDQRSSQPIILKDFPMKMTWGYSEMDIVEGDCWDGRYVEPLMTPAHPFIHLTGAIHLTVQTGELSLKDVNIEVSPFKLRVTLPMHKPFITCLPCAIVPSGVSCELKRPEGSTRLIELRVKLPVEERSEDELPDAGSKQWLMADALRGDGDTSAYDLIDVSSKKNGDGIISDDDTDAMQEDKFRILPDNVDAYTGLPLEEEDDTLPEDRWHKKDAQSLFHINQREDAIKEKWEKHEKEKAEREHDPDVEYIDADDFKPGGKYGPPLRTDANGNAITAEAAAAAMATESQQLEVTNQDLDQAANVLASNAAQKINSAVEGLSNQWTTLLD